MEPFIELTALMEATEKRWKRAHSKPSTTRKALQQCRQLIAEDVKSWCVQFVKADCIHMARLLSPEADTRRFGLRENSLCNLLLSKNILKTNGLTSVETRIRGWKCKGNFPQVVFDALASLPMERISSDLGSGDESSFPLTVGMVDALLTELSAHNPFTVDRSGRPPRNAPRSQQDILMDLFRGRRVVEIKWILSIILKHQPVPFEVLLRGLHPRFWQIYRHQTDLLVCCQMIDRVLAGEKDVLDGSTSVGIHISVMKLRKGKSPAHVVKQLQRAGEKKCFAEVKYDGERMQLHIVSGKVKAIFNKSSRNSTQDRALSHDIILKSLGIAPNNPYHPTRSKVHNAILEGEILVYNEKHGVEDYIAVQAMSRRDSGAPVDPHRHFKVVYFDLLHLNGQNLINERFEERRRRLREIVVIVPNYSEVSESHEIDLLDTDRATVELRNLFAEVAARPAEGLVVKGAAGEYTPRIEGTWYKLKKDYIEGFGDTAEFVLVAGSYQLEASKYLKMTRETHPNLLNVFYVACKSDSLQYSSCPKYLPLFDLSAGFSRDELLRLNAYSKTTKRSELSFIVEKGAISEHLFESFFDPPIVVQIMGGGFVKHQGFWTLRGPRLGKQLGWQHAVDVICYAEFERIAKESRQQEQFSASQATRLENIDIRILNGGPLHPNLRNGGSKVLFGGYDSDSHGSDDSTRFEEEGEDEETTSRKTSLETSLETDVSTVPVEDGSGPLALVRDVTKAGTWTELEDAEGRREGEEIHGLDSETELEDACDDGVEDGGDEEDALEKRADGSIQLMIAKDSVKESPSLGHLDAAATEGTQALAMDTLVPFEKQLQHHILVESTPPAVPNLDMLCHGVEVVPQTPLPCSLPLEVPPPRRCASTEVVDLTVDSPPRQQLRKARTLPENILSRGGGDGLSGMGVKRSPTDVGGGERRRRRVGGEREGMLLEMVVPPDEPVLTAALAERLRAEEVVEGVQNVEGGKGISVEDSPLDFISLSPIPLLSQPSSPPALCAVSTLPSSPPLHEPQQPLTSIQHLLEPADPPPPATLEKEFTLVIEVGAINDQDEEEALERQEVEKGLEGSFGPLSMTEVDGGEGVGGDLDERMAMSPVSVAFTEEVEVEVEVGGDDNAVERNVEMMATTANACSNRGDVKMLEPEDEPPTMDSNPSVYATARTEAWMSFGSLEWSLRSGGGVAGGGGNSSPVLWDSDSNSDGEGSVGVDGIGNCNGQGSALRKEGLPSQPQAGSQDTVLVSDAESLLDAGGVMDLEVGLDEDEVVRDGGEVDPVDYRRMFFHVPGFDGCGYGDEDGCGREGTRITIGDVWRTRRCLYGVEAVLGASGWRGGGGGCGGESINGKCIERKGKGKGVNVGSVMVLVPGNQVERWKEGLKEIFRSCLRECGKRDGVKPVYVWDVDLFLEKAGSSKGGCLGDGGKHPILEV
ncbi:hypothetical protein HDU97_007400 [Phlyctochytrium planicorne]|nr:hypothetical protein HDU97_007400 [Phlyctochytrium planicorne]